jgi:CheY-like chemotaxis protein
VVLNTVFASDLDNCRLDTVQLELAILNILVNARDAMPDGGRITLKTSNQLVDIEDQRHFPDLPPGAYTCISITDTGSGIPPEIVSRVMDPFFTTKEEGKGTGLGLSMVYGFAKQSGGATHLYSEVGIGTTVRMYFPATKDVLHADRQVMPRDPDLGGEETILVVDDRHEVAELSRDMLEGLGYKVFVANGGKEALQLVDSKTLDKIPDLLFSDIIMPGGMNGFVLAREIQNRLPDIKIILTTGYASTGDSGEREQSHEFEILKKPYRLSELARKVRRVLDIQSAST